MKLLTTNEMKQVTGGGLFGKILGAAVGGLIGGTVGY